MREGVTFLSPETTLVDADVQIGPDTVIYPGVIIEGVSSVGRESVIGPFTRIADAHVGRGVELKGWNLIAHTTVPNGSIVPPYVRHGTD
jgi:bifunctional UDP-N-acetylglucosamine pyrophosphorylase/glucosamine-1-phosphate N-acetyltransferase